MAVPRPSQRNTDSGTSCGDGGGIGDGGGGGDGSGGDDKDTVDIDYVAPFSVVVARGARGRNEALRP